MRGATPDTLADIHATSFHPARGWTTSEIAGLLASPHVFVVTDRAGFVMGRVVADEAELLTIAVLPATRGTGMGARLLRGFEANATERGAKRAFLEVAQDNTKARALYSGAGWHESGRRKGYYARSGKENVDAILMEKRFP
ncbi:GNAT family N-acetyltransferase [Aliiroseovarius sp. CAU 1755]